MSQLSDDIPSDADSFWNQLGDDAPPEAADWSGDELEQAYLQAMQVLEAAEAELPSTADDQERTDTSMLVSASVTDSLVIPRPITSELTSPSDAEKAAARDELAKLAVQRQETPIGQPPAVAPRQILEACLFVGGEPLSSKKLCGVLRGEFSLEYVERELDELNTLYVAEGRPYEIRLGEGGYRLTLRNDYERIRHKAYGLGPKEVRLSQEAMEVLAVVAYHQPITSTAIEELGKPSCDAILRQLLRRELIAVERQSDQPRNVAYRTTPRFLSLFGIRGLDELPRLEQVSYK